MFIVYLARYKVANGVEIDIIFLPINYIRQKTLVKDLKVMQTLFEKHKIKYNAAAIANNI